RVGGQLIGGDPPEAVMEGIAFRVPVALRHGEVDEVDVLVVVRDELELDTGRHHQLNGLIGVVGGQALLTDEPDRETGLLRNLPDRGLIRQLVRLDVPAGREPLAEFGVKMEEHAPLMHDEHRDGEVARYLGPGPDACHCEASSLAPDASAPPVRWRRSQAMSVAARHGTRSPLPLPLSVAVSAGGGGATSGPCFGQADEITSSDFSSQEMGASSCRP